LVADARAKKQATGLRARRQFEKKLPTVRCEERLAFTVKRPTAFVAGDYSEVSNYEMRRAVGRNPQSARQVGEGAPELG
jgi:hypothetical protein